MRERIEPEHIDRSVGEGSGTEMSKEGLEYFLAEGGRRIEEFEIEKWKVPLF